MRIDEHGTIVREQYEPGHPGDRGDSCADTSRAAVLSLFPKVNLKPFRTTKGYIRHPDVPDDWKESDFTSDQATPLLMAYDTYPEEYPEYANEMRARLSTWHTGNGDVVSPGLWCLINRHFHLLGLITVLQAFLFLIPLRWSDSNDKPGLQWGGDEGDYLNWIVTLEYLWARGIKWPTKICYVIREPKTVLNKVVIYLKDQPNSDFVFDIYEDHWHEVRRRI